MLKKVRKTRPSNPKRVQVDFHYDADLDDLFQGNMKEGTRTLGVAAEEDEEAFPPERHAGFRHHE